ncbi:MAG TPA: DUF3455 domain-containing protein [Planctomycetota bacterium]|nr:DUF3455 domain-containing protein [Planctomycetota bacterium]
MKQLSLAFALPFFVAACTAPAAPRAPSVPDTLSVPAHNHLMFELHATGVQIYTCQPKPNEPTKYEWALKAPDARLADARGDAGHHYGPPPTWESADGSKVVGKKEQAVDAPGADDISWLLLSATSNAGQGRFGKVTFIQRTATHGGKAPSGGCDAQHAGQEARVPYTATYCFYVAD